MAHPLEGAIAKLARAEEHFDSLEAEIEAFSEQNAQRALDVKFDGVWHTLFAHPPKEGPPARWSTICGDAVNNLRSSPDYVICELVRQAGQKPTRNNAFPIHADEGDYVRLVLSPKEPKKGALFRVPPGNAWTLVNLAQPYHSSDPNSHPLSILNRLARWDKHSSLAIHLGFPRPKRVFDLVSWNSAATLMEWRQPPVVPLSFEQHTDILGLRFFPYGPDPEVEVRGDLPIAPTFGDGMYQPASGYIRLIVGPYVASVVGQFWDLLA